MLDLLKFQINYAIDEGVACGKGANTVVSLLHHFFENHGLQEATVKLNADNCTGQNKNNTMIQVLNNYTSMYTLIINLYLHSTSCGVC